MFLKVRAAGMQLRNTLLCVALAAGWLQGQSLRVIRHADWKPFQMGDVTSNRIVHPGLGATKTTLNYSISKPGAEFAQHVHDYSDDTILVLQGEVDLKQGDSLRRLRAGECAFVPTGQIHGTVTAGTGEAIMISFQNPPDLVLYAGARDSKKPGAAPPKGIITPDAVKYITFADKNGPATSPETGSERAAFTHRVLRPGDSLQTRTPAEGEQILFVKSGAIAVRNAAGTFQAGPRDAIFIIGPMEVDVTAATAGTTVIQVEAPPTAAKQ